MQMPKEILKYVVDVVSRSYELDEEEIIELFENEATKVKKFQELLERKDLSHFEKNKYFREVLKNAKKRYYLLLRQHDRASVKEKEKILDEIISTGEKELYKKMLATHVSTLKRIEVYEEFYAKIFAETGRPKTILDIGAGINAFSVPFMNLKGVEYTGVEKKEKDIRLVRRYIDSGMLNGRIEKFDLNAVKTAGGKEELLKLLNGKYDLCLILKTIPLLERYNKGVSTELLKILPANKFAISGSRFSMVKGEDIEYRERRQIEKIISSAGLAIKKVLVFADEQVFIAIR